MNDDERRLHQDTMAARNEELRTIWLINGFFSAIHTAAAGFALAHFIDKGILIAMSSSGIAMSFLWYVSAERMWIWLAYWNRNLARLEDNVVEFKRVFGGASYEREAGRGISISRVIKTIITLIGSAWIILLFHALHSISK
ncbi:hypothetical protein HYT00_02600 [Candidatus Giovannonibacteria bacterium]|nr:hypothetical protein [Candidatus Giovannonibacteria bacterium]